MNEDRIFKTIYSVLSLIAVTASLMLLTNCASVSREERQRQAQAEEADWQYRKALLKSGTSYEAFIAAWGDASDHEVDRERITLLYDGTRPLIVTFENGILVGYRYDRDLEQRRENYNRALAEANATANRQRWGQALQDIGNSFQQPKTTNCTTSYIYGKAYTRCQ